MNKPSQQSYEAADRIAKQRYERTCESRSEHTHRCAKCRVEMDCESYFAGDHACAKCAAWFDKLDELGRQIPAGTFESDLLPYPLPEDSDAE